MRIRFATGREYTFCRVPRRIFERLLSANSAGQYYAQHIRGKYQC
ncbi:KTSC domain-containing protein [Synechococcus elongatus]